ncbi:hypothetical protein Tco_0161518 [Tanacetum coccineum]
MTASHVAAALTCTTWQVRGGRVAGQLANQIMTRGQYDEKWQSGKHVSECMCTRSSTTDLFSSFEDLKRLISQRNRGEPSLLFEFEEINMNYNNNQGPPPAGPIPAPDLQMMEELCEPTMNGRGDDANKQIDKFLTMTQSMKQNGVPHDITSSSPEIAALTQQIAIMNKNFLRMSQSNQHVYVVNPSYETCGGPHHYSECEAAGGFTQRDVYRDDHGFGTGGTRTEIDGSEN